MHYIELLLNTFICKVMNNSVDCIKNPLYYYKFSLITFPTTNDSLFLYYTFPYLNKWIFKRTHYPFFEKICM